MLATLAKARLPSWAAGVPETAPPTRDAAIVTALSTFTSAAKTAAAFASPAVV